MSEEELPAAAATRRVEIELPEGIAAALEQMAARNVGSVVLPQTLPDLLQALVLEGLRTIDPAAYEQAGMLPLVVRLAQALLLIALEHGAAGLRLTPDGRRAHVFLVGRDGEKSEVMSLSPNLAESIAGYFEAQTGARLARIDTAPDGNFQMTHAGRAFSVRARYALDAASASGESLLLEITPAG